MSAFLLQYARYHGLAVDHRSVNINELLYYSLQKTPSLRETQASWSLQNDLPGSDLTEHADILFGEKIPVTAAVLQRLQTTVIAKRINTLEDPMNWFLQDHWCHAQCKVPEPLLLLGDGSITDARKEVMRMRKKTSEVSILKSIQNNSGNSRPILGSVGSKIDTLTGTLEIWSHGANQQLQQPCLQVPRTVIQRLARINSLEPPDYEEFLRHERLPPLILDIGDDDYTVPDDCVSPSPTYTNQDSISPYKISSPTSGLGFNSTSLTQSSVPRGEPNEKSLDIDFDLSVPEPAFEDFIDWDKISMATSDHSHYPKSREEVMITGAESLSKQSIPLAEEQSMLASNLYVDIPAMTREEPFIQSRDVKDLLHQGTPKSEEKKADADHHKSMLEAFASLPKPLVPLCEKLPEIEPEVRRRLANPACSVGSEQFLCQIPRTKIFDQNSDQFQDIDMMSLKPDRHVSEQRDRTIPLAISNTTQAGLPAQQDSRFKCELHSMSPPPCVDQKLQNIGLKRKWSHDDCFQRPLFSATASLSTFLDLRGRKFKKPRFELDLIANGEIDDPIESTQGSSSETREQHEVGFETSVDQSSILSVPLPTLSGLAGPCVAFVNTDLLQMQPKLVAFLEGKGGEGLKLVYRDLDSTFESTPHIMLSPRSCIFVTNGQSLMQRSLPGQTPNTSSSLTHRAVQSLLESFDTVFVLVLQPVIAAKGISPTDAQTIAQFTGFCASISVQLTGVHVQPIWIHYTTASSLSESLNAHVWSLVAHEAQKLHGNHTTTGKESAPTVASNKAVTMIQDETLWELFLRKAGFNCMAAQTVLSALPRPGAHHRSQAETKDRPKETEIWGLPRFISMSAQDRLAMFANALGTRVLTRVNAVLDKPCYDDRTNP